MHSFTSCLMHCVWATRKRRPFIKQHLQERLWPYVGGIARENKMKALIVGGVEDHVHALLSIPATLSVAKSVQLLKGNSSKWIHDTFKEMTRYIQSQAEHHRKTTFKEELEVFLKKHGMDYVERDLE